MSAFISVSIRDTLSPSLEDRAKMMRNPRSLLAAAGKRLEVELKAHFERKNAQPNRNGWPARNFWKEVRRATRLTRVTETEAEVTVADARLNQKIYGGVVTPKRGKYLAIPATSEAYAAGSPRAGGLNLDVQVIHMGGGRTALALVEASFTSISFKKRKGQTRVKAGDESWGGRLHYWLVSSANPPADPDALPATAAIEAAIAAEVRAWLDRQSAPAPEARP